MENGVYSESNKIDLPIINRLEDIIQSLWEPNSFHIQNFVKKWSNTFLKRKVLKFHFYSNVIEHKLTDKAVGIIDNKNK